MNSDLLDTICLIACFTICAAIMFMFAQAPPGGDAVNGNAKKKKNENNKQQHSANHDNTTNMNMTNNEHAVSSASFPKNHFTASPYTDPTVYARDAERARLLEIDAMRKSLTAAHEAYKYNEEFRKTLARVNAEIKIAQTDFYWGEHEKKMDREEARKTEIAQSSGGFFWDELKKKMDLEEKEAKEAEEERAAREETERIAKFWEEYKKTTDLETKRRAEEAKKAEEERVAKEEKEKIEKFWERCHRRGIVRDGGAAGEFWLEYRDLMDGMGRRS
jgi:hypothetical protein